MSRRKDMLSAMLSGRADVSPPSDRATETTPDAAPPAQRPAPSMRSSAVTAMGRSLEQIASAAAEARALVAAGDSVIEIAVDKIEPSFVQDRLDGDDAEFFALVSSIRQRGQQVPVLLRPHPKEAGRFQIAYGHRRVRAARELGKTVRAVVLSLSDEELVVAQGQENSARVDLSFIERARFAASLEALGFDRSVICSALNTDKTHVSRYLSLAEAVPERIAKAIGPAPRAGRPRWTALADRLAHIKDFSKIDALLDEPSFRGADSDARFVQIFNALAPRRGEAKAKAKANLIRSADGRRLASIERGPAQVAIVLRDKDVPQFGEFLTGQIEALYAAFVKQKEEGAT